MSLFFADDTNLFINGSNINELESRINSELAEIAKWLKVNKLSFNINKTHYMIFTTKRKIIPGVVINIEGHIIHEVDSTKFLGIYLDNKLNWKKHIAYVSGKVARGIGLIIKARKFLNSDALITLYYSFIFPYLSYCIHIWGATYATNLQKLVIQQKKKNIRIIAGMKHREPTADDFRELRIIKFLDVNIMLIGCLMHKYHHELLPDIFHDYFQCVRKCIIITHDKIMGCMPVTWKRSWVRHVLGTEDLSSRLRYFEYRLTSEVSFKKALKQCIHTGLF